MASTKKAPAKRKGTVRSGTVKLWVMPGGATGAIAVGTDVYPTNRDGSIDVPAEMEGHFLAIGCTRARPKNG
jgi:hypothetical protein